MRLQFDLASIASITIAVIMAAISWGAADMRDRYQDRDIDKLTRAIDGERTERLAYQAQENQRRMDWLLKRADRRLDPDLSAVAARRN